MSRKRDGKRVVQRSEPLETGEVLCGGGPFSEAGGICPVGYSLNSDGRTSSVIFLEAAGSDVWRWQDSNAQGAVCVAGTARAGSDGLSSGKASGAPLGETMLGGSNDGTLSLVWPDSGWSVAATPLDDNLPYEERESDKKRRKSEN